MEEWKPIKGYDGLYEVSNNGRVRSYNKYGFKHEKMDNPRIIKQKMSNAGYLRVLLSFRGVYKNHSVHRLVASVFVENLNNKKYVNHLNGIKTDNKALNLEWCTRSENQYHAYENGLQKITYGEDSPNSKLNNDIINEIRQKWETGKYSQSQIGKMFNTHQSQISRIINGKTWSHI
jgi:predicted XRE-type DNA-binding protein